jgi:hypothetical protein
VLAAQLALALAALALCAFAPGFFLVRRFRWTPLEKLTGAVCLSLMCVWLTAWALYVLAPGAATTGAAAIMAISAVLAALAWRDALRLFHNARVRQVLVGFGFLLVWTLVILAAIRHYSGGGWGGDWLEHFQRTLIYLHHLPTSTEVFGGYRIPSRPPLEHVISAVPLALTGDRYEIFQVLFTVLNLLVFLSANLMLPLVARPWKFGVLPLVGIFALSPVIMVNATYTGVKALTAGLGVMAVAFYLRGWKKRDPLRMGMAFLAAAGASLAHYSGLPYAVFLGAHYLLAVFPRRANRWRELGVIAGCAAVPLLAWFGWCMAAFGVSGTFTSVVKASVGYGHAAQDGFFFKSFANLFDATVPHLVRDSNLVHIWRQPNFSGYVRDNVFLVYQTSLVFSMGIVGGPLVWWRFYRLLRSRDGAERAFWLALVPCAVAFNFIMAGERDHFGVAHLILMTMMVIGLSAVAGMFTLRRWLSLLLVAGCAVDFSLGVLLQARVEHLESTPDPSVFARILVGATALDLAPPGPETLTPIAGGNWFRKHQYALSAMWLRSLAASHPDGRGLAPAQETAREGLQEVVNQDDALYGGWYKRNGGETTYFGDHFGDSDLTSVLLVIGAAAILWKLARYAPPRALQRAPVKSAARKKR